MNSEPAAELCVARYVAQRVAGHVVLFALGVHHATGCVVFFRREPGDAFPPRFSLWHVRAEPPELHVLTPFAASISFQTTRKVERIDILDARGSMSISVDDLPEPALHDLV